MIGLLLFVAWVGGAFLTYACNPWIDDNCKTFYTNAEDGADVVAAVIITVTVVVMLLMLWPIVALMGTPK